MGIVEIKDNGVGMDADRLQKLKREMKENQETGKIGLSNIYMRVRIFYEDQGDVQIYSTEGEGTTVRICLPVKELELNKGEGIQCTEL